jgi:DNA-binding NarL/FixJ family response regulator
MVELVRQGLGTREIATELGVSPVTVRRHLAAVAEKLGAHGRGQLVRALGSV